ncbi:MAG: hypothetical protein WC554_11015 [Clostridia bacterium]
MNKLSAKDKRIIRKISEHIDNASRLYVFSLSDNGIEYILNEMRKCGLTTEIDEMAGLLNAIVREVC